MKSGLAVLILAGAMAASQARAEAQGLEPAAAFTPPATAALARLAPEGRLQVVFRPGQTRVRVIRGDLPPVGRDPRRAWPPLVLDLAADGDRLIPKVIAAPAGERWAWDWAAGPGRSWAVGQGGVAVLPVALREQNANCVHNGLLRLAWGEDGAVGQAKVQIGAEICAYDRFDAWATGAARLDRGAVADRQALIARDRALRAAEAPVAPLSDLARAHPGVNLAKLARAAGDSEPVYGLLADGAHYAAPCSFRFGEDPFCQGRTLPSYSWAKSLVGGLGLMRLEKLQPGAAQHRLADLAPDCAGRPPWSQERLIDLLDMASGRYGSSVSMADEDAPEIAAFFNSITHAEKFAFACGQYPKRAPAGEVFVYHTPDTYLLGVGLQRALTDQGGAKADLYDDLIVPIWRELGLSPQLDTTRRTLDGVRQPFTGWGLFLTRDDAVRLGAFLSPAGAARQDRLLDAVMIAEALQRPGRQGGLTAGSPRMRYRHGFWARDVAPLVGCDHPIWTPFLSGYGGLSLVLFPNNVVFYAFGDESAFDWGPAAEVADQIKGLCA